MPVLITSIPLGGGEGPKCIRGHPILQHAGINISLVNQYTCT